MRWGHTLVWSMGLALIHRWWQIDLFSLAPLVITWPLVISWLMKKPALMLLIFSQAMELLATTTPGLITLVVFTPYLLRWIFKGVEIDLSAKFIGAVLLSVISAIGIMAAPQIVEVGWTAQPWFILAMIGLASSGLVVTLCMVEND